MKLNIDNSVNNKNLNQEKLNTMNTEKTPVQNIKIISSPFQKLSDSNLKIDNIKNVQSFDSSMKCPDSGLIRNQLMSHSPQS